MSFTTLASLFYSSSHQTGSAAELAKEFLLTQAVGLHHLTEHLIRVVTGSINDAGAAD